MIIALERVEDLGVNYDDFIKDKIGAIDIAKSWETFMQKKGYVYSNVDNIDFERSIDNTKELQATNLHFYREPCLEVHKDKKFDSQIAKRAFGGYKEFVNESNESELDKFARLKPQMDIIADYHDKLSMQNIKLITKRIFEDDYKSKSTYIDVISTQELDKFMYEFIGVDTSKLESERRELLKALG